MTQSYSTDKLDKSNIERTANGASASDATQVPVPSETLIEHFEVLLEAVAVRLARAANSVSQNTNETGPEAALRSLRETVGECVEALEQLHATQRCVRRLKDRSGALIETRRCLRSVGS